MKGLLSKQEISFSKLPWTLFLKKLKNKLKTIGLQIFKPELRVIKNLGITKAPGLDYITNKLIKYLKPALLKVLHFFFNLCINFGIHPANWKIAKVIMLNKAGKLEDLAGNYRLLSLTSCLGKLLEKAIADNLSNWAEASKMFNKQQNGFRKNRSINDNWFNLFETIKLGFCKGNPTTGIFLDVEKAIN